MISMSLKLHPAALVSHPGRPARRNPPGAHAPKGAMLTTRAVAAVVTALCGSLFLAAPAARAQASATGAAFGESVDLQVGPLLGSAVQVSSGPLPVVSSNGPAPYSQTQQLAAASVSGALLGQLLSTGVLNAAVDSTAPATLESSASASVANPKVQLVGLLPVLTLGADLIQSTATISGPCTGSPVATGSTTLAHLTLGGPLGTGITANAAPAPNTVLLSLAGIRIVLNEQIPAVNGNTASITVNAVHVSLSSLSLAGIGVLSGDIVLGQSHAEMACDAAAGSADLGVTLAGAPSPVTVGSNLTLVAVVTNHGPDSAAGVELTGVLPANLTPVSALATAGSCTSGTTVSCSLGNLASGAAAPVTVVAVPQVAGTLTDAVSVVSSTPDPTPGNNQASASVTVQSPAAAAQAQLVLTGKMTPDPATTAQTITTTLTLTNLGPSVATGTLLAINLPAGATLVSVTTTMGPCSGTGPVTCNLGTLTSGGAATVTLTLQPTRQGTVVVTGEASSAVPDPDPAMAQAQMSDLVTAPAGTVAPGNPAGPGSASASCDLDTVPAATLLIPYFAVDLGNTNGLTTLFSVTNAFAGPRLAKVTMWTDWAVPSLSFTVYLTGFDVQTFNVRDLLAGQIPGTGPGVSPLGSLSDSNSSFPGCTGNGPAALPDGKSLSANQVAHLRAWHTGQQSPLTGNCAASPRSNTNLAVGYVTVDEVVTCSALTPADPGYFTGVAGYDNVLFGDFAFVDPTTNRSDGDPAVHIVADQSAFKAGDYTFYGRYVNGSAADARRPLGTLYASRYLNGGAFDGGTTLMAWRDTKSAFASGVACGTMPPWAPLIQNGVVAFDEEENSISLASSTTRAGAAVQELTVGSDDVPTPSPFGWMMIDLSHGSTGSLFGATAQGWVVTVFSAVGKYSIGQRAIRLNSACNP